MNNYKKFIEYRNVYSEFVYSGYEMKNEDGKFLVRYFFEIPGLSSFVPTWEFPCEVNEHKEAVEQLVFSLGMVELISYWKTVCPKTVKISCGTLSKEQIKWWKELYFHGLGEFFYVNGIPIFEESRNEQEDGAVSVEDFMNIQVDSPSSSRLRVDEEFKGFLVPVGGGKDSVVSLELLKEMGEAVTTFSINRILATKRVIDLFQEKEEDVLVGRKLDPRLIELNKQGFLNGHTPFSAIVAFASTLTALIYKKKFVALSNETSANETTVASSTINHQYSKSLAFERDFRWYMNDLMDIPVSYFSLLRPLSELQIAKLFSGYEKYHKVFRSCNAGSKVGEWCLHCPKCLFVYIIMLPFLSEDTLLEIFSENLLEKQSMEVYFRELTGINENKPFECVGTRREVLAACKYRILNNDLEGFQSPYLLETYRDYILSEGEDLNTLLNEWVDENEVLPEYRQSIKRSLNL